MFSCSAYCHKSQSLLQKLVVPSCVWIYQAWTREHQLLAYRVLWIRLLKAWWWWVLWCCHGDTTSTPTTWRRRSRRVSAIWQPSLCWPRWLVVSSFWWTQAHVLPMRAVVSYSCKFLCVMYFCLTVWRGDYHSSMNCVLPHSVYSATSRTTDTYEHHLKTNVLTQPVQTYLCCHSLHCV